MLNRLFGLIVRIGVVCLGLILWAWEYRPVSFGGKRGIGLSKKSGEHEWTAVRILIAVAVIGFASFSIFRFSWEVSVGWAILGAFVALVLTGLVITANRFSRLIDAGEL